MSWHDAGTDDLDVACARRVTIGNHVIAVVRDSLGDLYAIDDTCTHADISLSEGEIGPRSIECWGHCAQFDLVTGEGELPAPAPVNTYRLKTEGGRVLVEI